MLPVRRYWRPGSVPRSSAGFAGAIPWGEPSEGGQSPPPSEDPVNAQTPERIFTLRELTRLLRLTPKRLGQLRRLGLLHDDSGGYRFRELVAARAAAALLERGATVRQVKDALQGARRLAPDAAEPLSELEENGHAGAQLLGRSNIRRALGANLVQGPPLAQELKPLVVGDGNHAVHSSLS